MPIKIKQKKKTKIRIKINAFTLHTTRGQRNRLLRVASEAIPLLKKEQHNKNPVLKITISQGEQHENEKRNQNYP